MKNARKTTPGRKARRATPALSLSMRVERLEKAVLFPPTAAAAQPPARFSKLFGPDTSKHLAVHDASTNLIWSAGIIGEANWEKAGELAKACRLLGHEDWRLPTIQELLSIVDYERYDPVVDKEFFHGPYGWTWTSTTTALPSGYARGVLLGYGLSNFSAQSYRLRVRAVRAGQSLSLGL